MLLNDFAQSCSRKMRGVGGKKENDHYGLPPAGSSRVNQMCIPYLCRSKAYPVRYNVHMKWGWQRNMLIIIDSWSLLVTFTNLLFFFFSLFFEFISFSFRSNLTGYKTESRTLRIEWKLQVVCIWQLFFFLLMVDFLWDLLLALCQLSTDTI